MNQRDEPLTFSLLGGPLYRLGRRIGLVRGEANMVPLGLAVGGSVWIAIVTLAYLEGVGARLWSMEVIGAHARLLLVIPLFFIGESWAAPQMSDCVRSIAGSSLVTPRVRPALNAAVARTHRWTNAWWPEAVCLLVAILVEATGTRLQTYGATSGADPARDAAGAHVYVLVGLTMFRFLLFRGLWKLWLWGHFLWRLSRLDLRLMPGHPDRSGGLGYLQFVHERFTPLIAALSVLECASLAEDIARSAATITAAYPLIAGLMAADAVLFLGPLLVFTDKLWASRTAGLTAYMTLGGRYVTEFERKWLARAEVPTKDALMSTGDFSAMTDLASSITVVRSMRAVPIGARVLTRMGVAALVPFAPLLLFKYPVDELAQALFSRLIGL
jgi:hypothetical protein